MFRSLFVNSVCVMVVVAAFVRCGDQGTAVVADANPILWEMDEPTRIEVSSHDTAGLYYFDLLLMVNYNFDWRPTELKMTVVAPDSTRFTEEITFSNFQSIRKHHAYYQLSQPYRDSVKLEQAGTYYFDMSPLHDIAGVKSIGLNIRNILNGEE